jgi:phosphonate transport system substrate-binding protein
MPSDVVSMSVWKPDRERQARRRPFRGRAWWCLGLILAALLLRPDEARAQPADQGLLIGLLPELNIFKQKARFQLLGDYLSHQVGVPVRFTILSRYGNILERFQTEKMDGAFFGSFTGALAIEKLGVVPLARPINLDGSSTYQGYLLVRRDSGIRRVEDMRGKRMAFVDRATTAGYAFPLAWLRERGILSYETYFKEHYFTGSHDAAVDAVRTGAADVGAAKHSVYNRMRQENPALDKELLVLAESAPVPSNGLGVRRDLDPKLQARLREALLSLHEEPEGAAVLKQFGALRFIRTTAEDYQPVLDMAKKAGIDMKRYDYRNK